MVFLGHGCTARGLDVLYVSWLEDAAFIYYQVYGELYRDPEFAEIRCVCVCLIQSHCPVPRSDAGKRVCTSDDN